jgi:hypothetical protein
MIVKLSEFIEEWIDYNPTEGKLYWKKTRGGRKAGTECGSYHKEGYRHMMIHGKTFLTHRIIWFIEKGYEPIGIDHINGVKDDNHISNLREADQLINAKNSSKRKSTTSKFIGVSANRGKWEARITVKGVTEHIGTFLTEDTAHEARLLKEKEYGFHPNHGR